MVNTSPNKFNKKNAKMTQMGIQTDKQTMAINSDWMDKNDHFTHVQ